MKGELVTAIAKDELILHGMCCPSTKGGRSDACVIHIHGSYGNFYENFFLSEMSRSYTERGFTFLSIGTRGRDYYADFKLKKHGHYDSVRVGGIREVFQDCEHDIVAWREYAATLGFSKIVLQGHSLGAMKAVYYLKHHPKSVAGLVLISPPDNFGLQNAEYGAQFKDDLATAKEIAASGENILMPESAYYESITGKSFLSLLAHPHDTGMFTYSDVALMRQAGLGRIDCPTLVTFATENEAVVGPLDKCIKALRSVVHRKNLLHCELIEGANHNYHFREAELASVISDWLERTFHPSDIE